MEKNGDGKEDKKVGEQGLPLDTSPYVKYSDLEDYKRKGYGTEGHMEPVERRGGGATDAPTPSGAASALSEEQIKKAHDIKSAATN